MNTKMTLDYALKEGFVDLQRFGDQTAGNPKFHWFIDVRRCPFSANDTKEGLYIVNRETHRTVVVDYEMLSVYGVDHKNVVANYEIKVAHELNTLFPADSDDSFKKGFDDGAWHGGEEPGCDFSGPQ